VVSGRSSKTNNYVFGDKNNGISIFAEVNYSVAMGNAEGNVKQAADLVTLDYEKEGIEFALRKLQVL